MNRERRIAIDTETQDGKAFVVSHAGGCIMIDKGRRKLFHDLRKLGRVFVFYNMDFDVSALLKWFKSKIWRKLYIEKHVTAEGYSMRYFPNKMWRVSGDFGMIECFDLFSFFQCSLDKAAKLCGIKKRKIKLPEGAIEKFKDFWRKNPKVSAAYAQRDSEILQEICDKMQIAMENIGLGGADWYSPGYIAKRYFQLHGIRFGKLNRKHEAFCEQGYFGARIEVARRGTFKGSHGVDLKSAYPFAMSQLPNFANARMWYSKKPETNYFVARVRVWMPPAKFYPLPVRHNDTIYFPRFNGEQTHCTQDEIACVLRHGGKVKFEKALNVECDENERPYAKFIGELFALRKTGGMEGLLYKLILNSAYGISAEMHGDYRHVSELTAIRHVENSRLRTQYDTFLVLQSRLCPHAKRFWEKKCECNVCNDTRRLLRNKSRVFRDIAELDGELYRRVELGGKMRNVLVAMNITASTRVRVFDAIMKKPEEIISCQTDGIFSRSRLPISEGSNLGEWEYQGESDLLMIGCGVYRFGTKQKLRGFHFHGNMTQILRDARKGVAQIPLRNRMTMGRVIRGGAEHSDLTMNELVATHKNLDLNFDRKRIWSERVKCGKDLLRNQFDSKAYDLQNLLAN